MTGARIDPLWTRRAIRALVLACLSSGCGPDAPPPPPISAAHGRLVGATELLILPSGPWNAEAGRLTSTWPGAAVLQIRDSRPQPAALELRLWPTEAPRTRRWVRWDGQRVEWMRTAPGGEHVVEIPAEKLGGSHLLEFRWNPTLSTAPVFESIAWRSGGDSGRLAAADLPRLRRIDEFLRLGLVQVGVAESASVSAGGLLALGSATPRLSADAGRRGLFRFEARNLEGAPAELSVVRRRALGGRELWSSRLAPGESADGAVELAPGDIVELRREPAAEESLTLWGQPRFSERAGRSPLVLLVTLDTTRRDVLGAYGDRDGLTPNLDRLAATATLFERAYSTTSWTLPAHASLFTGLQPRQHGAGVVDTALRSEFATLASLLAPRYRAAALVGGPLLRPTFGVGRGFGSYLAPAGVELAGGDLTRRATQLLRTHADEPLLLFVNYFDPHFPFRRSPDLPAGARAERAVAALAKESTAGRLLAGDDVAFLDVIERRVRLDAAERAALALAYRAEVAEMDRRVGELLDAVRAAGRFEDALVVVASDHGEMLGERDLYSHGVRLEPELTDIPLLVKYPGQGVPRRVAEPVSLADLFPTILAVAGIEAPAATDGGALVLTDERSLARRDAVSFEEHESEVHPFYASVRLGPNLIGRQGRVGRSVRWDGGEACWRTDDGTARTADCGDEALAALRSALAALELKPRVSDRVLAPPVDAEERKRLRALGYL